MSIIQAMETLPPQQYLTTLPHLARAITNGQSVTNSKSSRSMNIMRPPTLMEIADSRRKIRTQSRPNHLQPVDAQAEYPDYYTNTSPN